MPKSIGCLNAMSFLDHTHFPSASAEQHYLEHDNRTDDPAHRNFLSITNPFAPSQSATRLDFAVGLDRTGRNAERTGVFHMLYDPFFHPDKSSLQTQYDFITCTETAEHFHDPFAEFDSLTTC